MECLCISFPELNGGTLVHQSDIDEIKAKIRELLATWDINCVLLLGADTLKLLGGIGHSLGTYRGSRFVCETLDSPLLGYKCLATYDPQDLIKDWSNTPLFGFDVVRFVSEGGHKELKLRKRNFVVAPTHEDLLSKLRAIKTGDRICIDIEGGLEQDVHCIGFATSVTDAFIVPLKLITDDAKRREVLVAVRDVLYDPTIEKVMQNGLYDWFVLFRRFGIHIRGFTHDTMLSGWEIYPELGKGLGTQASIWTDEPYYKFERTVDDDITHFTYCLKDCVVTYEIHLAHMAAMNEAQMNHYKLNMALLAPVQYMEAKGINYDVQGAAQYLKDVVEPEMNRLQDAAELACGIAVNINSPKQMCEVLYQKLKLEPQYQKLHGRKTNKLTADAEALMKLKLKFDHSFVNHVMNWKLWEGLRKQLEMRPDKDGRMRCSYNVVGTDTGRLSCSKSLSGTGANLQTITSQLRRFYRADPGYTFFQLDLSGADGWTVAARCADCNDPTMLDDYLAGLKPAKIIAVMKQYGADINKLSRPELIEFIKAHPVDKVLYDVCKVVQHGTNYIMQPRGMAANVLGKSFQRSFGKQIIQVNNNQCLELQNLYFLRYPGVKSWHRWVESQLKSGMQLECASGHVRTFFGSMRDPATLGAAVAHEPQANTTFATNMAMLNLWLDRENRRADGSLIINLLHSVHDALCGQFPSHMLDWVKPKLKTYFDNPITIGTRTITIPFEAGFGPSWGELETQEL